jgi:dual adaptor for phosphotyrosine/3-phosphotyrosine/3-phosphoinositide
MSSVIPHTQIFPEEVENLSWYHYNATRHIAESLLLQNGEDGFYLLRPSSRLGELALSVRCKESVKHFNISWNGREYRFGMGQFASIKDFIEHFENQPLLAGESGVLTLLKQPYPRDVEEPKTYETVRIHAELGRPQSPKINTSFSLGSKEGFLTKQGGTVKSWKLRWFTLLKTELKYFKDKNDREPIRTLDLKECTLCARDKDLGKENCFKLVFHWRTFHMFSATEDDANQWIKLIQWKLENIHKTGGGS